MLGCECTLSFLLLLLWQSWWLSPPCPAKKSLGPKSPFSAFTCHILLLFFTELSAGHANPLELHLSFSRSDSSVMTRYVCPILCSSCMAHQTQRGDREQAISTSILGHMCVHHVRISLFEIRSLHSIGQYASIVFNIVIGCSVTELSLLLHSYASLCPTRSLAFLGSCLSGLLHSWYLAFFITCGFRFSLPGFGGLSIVCVMSYVSQCVLYVVWQSPILSCLYVLGLSLDLSVISLFVFPRFPFLFINSVAMRDIIVMRDTRENNHKPVG